MAVAELVRFCDQDRTLARNLRAVIARPVHSHSDDKSFRIEERTELIQDRSDAGRFIADRNYEREFWPS